MENASKALIIAGGVFLAIVMLVIVVELFVEYRKVAENYDYVMTFNEITKINKKFTQYERRKNIKIQEITTAVRTAQSYNEKYGESIIIINVKVKGISWIAKSENDLLELIKNNSDKEYECSITYYSSTENNAGLIKEINFTE